MHMHIVVINVCFVLQSVSKNVH